MEKIIKRLLFSLLAVTLPLIVVHVDSKDKLQREAAKEQIKKERERMKHDKEMEINSVNVTRNISERAVKSVKK
tara:strand:+ start:154 stop:375 length:222 start_codon:yes stop_codon:yes gene_type:complete